MPYVRYRDNGSVEYSNGELFLDFIGNTFERRYIDYIDIDLDGRRLRVWFDDSFKELQYINPISRFLTGLNIGGDLVVSIPAVLERTGLVREAPLDDDTIDRLNSYIFGSRRI